VAFTERRVVRLPPVAAASGMVGQSGGGGTRGLARVPASIGGTGEGIGTGGDHLATLAPRKWTPAILRIPGQLNLSRSAGPSHDSQ